TLDENGFFLELERQEFNLPHSGCHACRPSGSWKPLLSPSPPKPPTSRCSTTSDHALPRSRRSIPRSEPQSEPPLPPARAAPCRSRRPFPPTKSRWFPPVAQPG